MNVAFLEKKEKISVLKGTSLALGGTVYNNETICVFITSCLQSSTSYHGEEF